MAIGTFVNLPVQEFSSRGREFFTKIGFSFNERFSDKNTACMIISDDASAIRLAFLHTKP